MWEPGQQQIKATHRRNLSGEEGREGDLGRGYSISKGPECLACSGDSESSLLGSGLQVRNWGPVHPLLSLVTPPALLSVEVLCSQVLAGNRHGVQPGPTALGLFPGPRPGEVQGPGTKSA